VTGPPGLLLSKVWFRKEPDVLLLADWAKWWEALSSDDAVERAVKNSRLINSLMMLSFLVLQHTYWRILQCISTGNEVVALGACIDAMQICPRFAESHASHVCLQADKR